MTDARQAVTEVAVAWFSFLGDLFAIVFIVGVMAASVVVPALVCWRLYKSVRA